MTTEQFVSLVSKLNEITATYYEVQESDASLESKEETTMIHISGKLYAMFSPSYKLIHVRRAFKRDGKLLPSKFQVSITNIILN